MRAGYTVLGSAFATREDAPIAKSLPFCTHTGRECDREGVRINPAVTEAFWLAIVAKGGLPPFPGPPGKKGDMKQAPVDASNVDEAAAMLDQIAPGGSYLSETNFFRKDWREAFWGANYARLKKLKNRYDPDGVFFVHHGVGSEDWSSDGFTRIAST